eukprot:CAMPEP_0181212684 /NCGR_PEP_ID=MMETSP1096-20121128/24486_1 /TAXON_ID=156174 ORGANISM="Chrysochromulina ericina, Strain CCMP281" /NCGR_SAMPLE_ID=MMETSP1096 /ASSEMBLY_ACC=CAM_ASM_000453 /LENGTH=103 /DNA_ID=CAMNT_0023304239 /DNA_START=292 /DNA_END=603 /DNA_ORIENTATION=-
MAWERGQEGLRVAAACLSHTSAHLPTYCTHPISELRLPGWFGAALNNVRPLYATKNRAKRFLVAIQQSIAVGAVLEVTRRALASGRVDDITGEVPQNGNRGVA